MRTIEEITKELEDCKKHLAFLNEQIDKAESELKGYRAEMQRARDDIPTALTTLMEVMALSSSLRRLDAEKLLYLDRSVNLEMELDKAKKQV